MTPGKRIIASLRQFLCRTAPKLSEAALKRLRSEFDAREWNNPDPDDAHVRTRLTRRRAIFDRDGWNGGEAELARLSARDAR